VLKDRPRYRQKTETNFGGSVKAKFHYAIWFEADRRPASNQLRTIFEAASVMQFGFRFPLLYSEEPKVICGHVKFLIHKQVIKTRKCMHGKWWRDS